MALRLRRAESIGLTTCLVAVVLALDGAWAVLGLSSDSPAYGLFDEPAHLATCLLALLALAALVGGLSPAFWVAALVASVAIDIDHLPQMLGWDGVSAGAPRPYTHSLAALALPLLLAIALSGTRRNVALGVGFGIGAHLLRDLATGPGVALALPLSSAPVKLPYSAYVVALVALSVLAVTRAQRRGRRSRPLLGGARATCGVSALIAIAALFGVAPAQPAEAASRVAIGAYLPGADHDPGPIDRYAATVGRRPEIVHAYPSWGMPAFDPRLLGSLTSRGSVPMLTWEPWGDWHHPISLWEIAAGRHDRYLVESARQAAAWGGPVFVRFGHEMNGDWYPWGRGNHGNTAAAFRAAWRHIVGVFRWAGAGNVRWVWTPYVDGGKLPFKRFYPGERWVDWVGLDGFNWGRPFTSFAKVFGPSYRKLTRMTRKPLIVAETGSVEHGGDKATWVRRTLRRTLPRFRRVRALLWWNEVHPDGTDWRIDTSSRAATALASSLRSPRYRPGHRFLLDTKALLATRRR